jgi:hypothetical protein
MYSVYQPWDPLKVCVVGRSYPPEFYSWIKSSNLRNLFERIAIETEEDYQNIIKKLTEFGVKVVRPNVPNILVDEYLTSNQRIPGPISMNPRDQMIMIGNKFYLFPFNMISIKTSGRNIPGGGWTKNTYDRIRGPDWPTEFVDFNKLPIWIQQEIKTIHKEVKFNIVGEDHAEIASKASMFDWWDPIITEVEQAGNHVITNLEEVLLDQIPANGITRIGKDLYFGDDSKSLDKISTKNIAEKYFSDYRCHWITTGGHIDGCFTPVKPGLIVSIKDIQTYQQTFPGWEVVYLPNESWSKVSDFLALKHKNQGRWWIKDYEHDSELIDFVETWLKDWTGYAEESVFDVNILVIDEKNIIVNGYNKTAFDAFHRHGITAHICPVRHRYFWDGGVHCITLDLNREGTMQDYFPSRQ